MASHWLRVRQCLADQFTRQSQQLPWHRVQTSQASCRAPGSVPGKAGETAVEAWQYLGATQARSKQCQPPERNRSTRTALACWLSASPQCLRDQLCGHTPAHAHPVVLGGKGPWHRMGHRPCILGLPASGVKKLFLAAVCPGPTPTTLMCRGGWGPFRPGGSVTRDGCCTAALSVQSRDSAGEQLGRLGQWEAD